MVFVVFVVFVELRRVVVKVKARLGEVRGLAFHLVSCATCCFLRAIVKEEVSHGHVESDVILYIYMHAVSARSYTPEHDRNIHTRQMRDS